jgi:hypothetical protein
MQSYLTLFTLLLVSICNLYGIDFGNRNATQYYPFEEWSVTNNSYSGNAFDVIATVTYTHTSGAQHVTQMFYDSNNTWKWRFSASLTGSWSFSTSSSDSDLNGHTGTITVSPNTDPNIKGYVRGDNEKWYWTGNNKRFTPNYVMYFDDLATLYNNPTQIDADIQEFMDGHGFTGFHVRPMGLWFDYDKSTNSVSSNASDPDPKMFEIMELLITKTYLAGGATHFWWWGDDSRGQTPISIGGSGGGINGAVDKRLQRYIAARLGPIPGWTTSYGFDLFEWVNGSQLTEWHDYVQDRLGWNHLMGARSDKNQLNQISEAMDYSSYEQHRPDYDKYVETITERPFKPSFSEDRFRIRNQGRSKDFAQDGSDSRTTMWNAGMAGGVAGIWGNLWDLTGSARKSDPYPNKDQIKTYATFFVDNNRLLYDMERANQLSSNSNTRILKTPDNQNFVLYRENANSIQINLSSASGPLTAVAVNTKNAYQEINLGMLSPTNQTISLPSTSDWAVAIGTFPDAVGCSININTNTNAVTCSGDSDGSITTTVSGGESPYTYAWSNGVTTPNLNNLSEGTYTLTVTDDDGCVVTTTATVTAATVIALNTSVTNTSDETATDGAIDLTVNGGTSPYTYLWNSGASTQDLSELGNGIYEVTVTDNNGCVATTTETVSSGPCAFQEMNGSVTIEAEDYAEIQNQGDATDWEIANSISGAVGSYVTTPDGSGGGNASFSNGSKLIYNIKINNSGNYTIYVRRNSPDGSGNSVHGGFNGQATGAQDNGGGDNQWQWASLGSANLGVGNHTVEIARREDGYRIDRLVVTSGSQPSGNGPTASTCGTPPFLTVTPAALDFDENGGTQSINITSNVSWTVSENVNWLSVGTTSGSGNATLSVVADPNTTTNSRTATITITDGLITRTVTVSQDGITCTLSASGNSTLVSCFGNSDGSATITASGGTSPYTYLWDTGATTTTITNIAAGTYSVTVTDDIGCSVIENVVVSEPTELTVNISSTDETIAGASDGAATASASGGTSPYTYLWSTNETTNSISGLSVGTYEVTVTDANNCTETASATVAVDCSSFSVALTATNTTCSDAVDGSVTSSTTNGAAPFTYMWSNGSTTPNLTNVVADDYTLTITDANGCVEIATATVGAPAALTLTMSSTDESTPTASDGTASVSAGGGTMPYTYLWNTTETTSNISGLSSGIYEVTVTDTNGCTETATVTVAIDCSSFTGSLTATDATCSDVADGAVMSTTTNGVTPFTYVWSNGSATPDLTNVAADSYTVTITDAIGCTATATITVSSPTALTLGTNKTDESSPNTNDGTATVTANGGTTPYTYLWNTGVTTASINGLSPGGYTVTVTDANNCTATAAVTIEAAVAGANEYWLEAECGDIGANWITGTDNDASEGEFMEITSGNNSQSSAPSGIDDRMRYTFNLLQAGGYKVYFRVRSPNAQGDSFWVRVNEGTWIKFNSITTNDEFRWIRVWDSDDGLEPVVFNMNAGENTLDVTYREEDTKLDKIYITQNGTAPADADFGPMASNCVPPVNLTVNPTSLSVDASSSTPSFNITSNVNWTVTTSEAWMSTLNPTSGSNNGTVNVTVNANPTINNRTGWITISGGGLTQIVTINQDGIPCTLTAAVSATYVDCFGGTNGTANVVASGGTAPYTYLWDGGETTADLTNVLAGTYTVTVTDDLGCTAIESVQVSEPTMLSITMSSTEESSAGAANGTATATVNGGTAPYTYLWNTGATTASISDLTAGTYEVTVTDANSCTTFNSVTVSVDCSSFSVSLSPTSVACNGLADGSITTIPTNGVAPYTYLWNNGETTADLTNVLAGTYTVTVTDNIGCAAVGSVQVSEPSALTVTMNSTEESSAGAADGTATASASGGTAPYTYSWSNGATTPTVTNLPPNTYTLTVTDANSCTETASVVVNAAPMGANEYWLEAECGTVGSKWISTNSSEASEGIFMQVTPGTNSTSSAPMNAEDHIRFDFDLLQSGNYKVYLRLQSGGGSDDSFWVRANNGSWIKFNGVSTSNEFQWKQVWDSSNGAQVVTFNMNLGSNTLDVAYREDGTYLDKVYITQNGTPPTDPAFGTVASNCGPVPNLSINPSNLSYAEIGATQSTTVTSNIAWTANTTAPWLTLNPTSGTGNSTIDVTATANNSSTPRAATVNISGGGITRTLSVNQAGVVCNLSVASSSSSVSCFGGSDGTASVGILGGTPPFSYLWNTGATSTALNGLSAGTYSVTVTGGDGCTNEKMITVSEPPALTLNIGSTDESSTSIADGTASVSVTGGTAPYSYSWSNSTTDATATGLTAGNYTITVTDANNCTQVASVEVNVAPTGYRYFRLTVREGVNPSYAPNMREMRLIENGVEYPDITGSEWSVTASEDQPERAFDDDVSHWGLLDNLPANLVLDLGAANFILPTDLVITRKWSERAFGSFKLEGSTDNMNWVNLLDITGKVANDWKPGTEHSFPLQTGGSNQRMAYVIDTEAQNGIIERSPAKMFYQYGEAVTLRASPYPGYEFQGWEGDVDGTTDEVTIIMNTPMGVIANFLTAAQPWRNIEVNLSLQGVLENAEMRNDLNSILEYEDPYELGERVSSMPTGAVDWVTIELRNANDPSIVEASRACLLHKDGYVIDLDGARGVKFDVPNLTSAYIVVKHRNHLSMMTAQPVAFGN